MIRLNDEQYSLYAPVAPHTEQITNTEKDKTTMSRIITHALFTELREKRGVSMPCSHRW